MDHTSIIHFFQALKNLHTERRLGQILSCTRAYHIENRFLLNQTWRISSHPLGKGIVSPFQDNTRGVICAVDDLKQPKSTDTHPLHLDCIVHPHLQTCGLDAMRSCIRIEFSNLSLDRGKNLRKTGVSSSCEMSTARRQCGQSCTLLASILYLQSMTCIVPSRSASRPYLSAKRQPSPSSAKLSKGSVSSSRSTFSPSSSMLSSDMAERALSHALAEAPTF